MPEESIQKLLNRTEAAEFLGVKPETLNAWSHHKRYDLPYIKIGRLVKYRYCDLLKFIESRSQNLTGGENV